MKLKILFIFVFCSCSMIAQQQYHKGYYDNGNLKTEGWLNKKVKVKYWKTYYKNGTVKNEGHYIDGKPSDYWYFYRENGSKEKEGHFAKGKKQQWWLFYDTDGAVSHKIQLKNNLKNGYCLRYKGKKIVRIEKYKDDKKIDEWTDLKSFKKENKLSDLL